MNGSSSTTMCNCNPPSKSRLSSIKFDYQTRIRHFQSYINSLCDKELNRTDIIELQLRCDKIESIYKLFEDVQLQHQRRDLAKYEGGMLNDNSLEDSFYKTLAIAKNLLHKHNINHTESTTTTEKTTTPKPVQFPLIQLPKFNGDSNKWLHFREAFTCLIHSNDLIDDMEKFRYLKASMDGSAAILIQSVDFSPTNYTAAWELLNETYNDTNKLVQCHLSALFGIEVIQKSSSTALKGFIDQLVKNMQALELLGQPVKKWDILLLHLLSPKLDQITHREWEKYSSKKDSTMTVDAFLQFLRIRADFMETREMDEQDDDNISELPMVGSLAT